MRVLISSLVIAVAAGRLAAQAPPYQPAAQLPSGRQIVAIYLGADWCHACHDPALEASLHALKPLLATQARRAGAAFAAIGVSLDWSVDSGYAFLRPLGPFDEVAVGGNWANLAAERFIWADSSVVPALPQLVVLERVVDARSNGIRFSRERVLQRFTTPAAVVAWVRRGAPLAAAAP